MELMRKQQWLEFVLVGDDRRREREGTEDVLCVKCGEGKGGETWLEFLRDLGPEIDCAIDI